MKLSILSIIFTIFTITNIALSQTYSKDCFWWVNNANVEPNPTGSFSSPFKDLKDAVGYIISDNNTLCDNTKDTTSTRVIYIIASDKDDINNVYKSDGGVKFDEIFNLKYTILIQAVVQPTEYTFNSSSPILPLSTEQGKYATFYGGVPTDPLMSFLQCSVQFILKGIQFRNGGYATYDYRQASVVVTTDSSVSFDSCLFRDNVGGASGALFYKPQRKAYIINCKFENNIANNTNNGQGGAINLQVGQGQVTINNTIFSGNKAVYGGAVFSSYQNLIMFSNTFFNNTATKSGGGLYTLGIIRTERWEDLIFDSNKAINGSGLYDKLSYNEYFNTKFISNEASGFGGGAYFLDSTVLVYKSIFKGNKAPSGGGVFATDESDEEKINQLFIKESNFTMNEATENGGALYCVNAIARFNTLDLFEDNLAVGNSSSNTDYCSMSCKTAAGDCGCPGGCGIESNDKNKNKNAIIAVAIFIPITAILLGVVGFLLWKTHTKSSKMRTKVAPYDEIRLSPASQDTDDQL